MISALPRALLRPGARCLRAPSRARSLLASIDQGTSSSRVILYDETLTPVGSHQVELKTATSSPRPGWSQMDPMAILHTVNTSARRALEQVGAKPSDLVGIGVTNQRESTVVWDRRSGTPLCDVILWHDVRTAATSAMLAAELGGVDSLRASCGLPVSTYFSGVKLRWLLDNVPAVKQGFEEGTALFGTVDSWIIWNLTGGAHGGPPHARPVIHTPPPSAPHTSTLSPPSPSPHPTRCFSQRLLDVSCVRLHRVGASTRHVTDVSNASRTMLMDLNKCEWDSAAIEALGLGAVKPALPEIVSSAEPIGTVANGGALDGAPICGIIGDQQGAMIGQRCFHVGEAKITYGTGAFLLKNVGTTPVPSTHGLLSTVLYKLGPAATTTYALEGAVASCAVGINWFRDSLGMLRYASEVSELAAEVDHAHGLYFVPAFGGLLAPHWREDARGTLVGLTLAHDRRHVSRAVLDGIAHQAKDVVDSMVADTGAALKAMRVDGGVSMSDPLLQSQADLLNIDVERPADVETTAAGAAICAGLGAGVWDGIKSVPAPVSAGMSVFSPRIASDERERRRGKWRQAVTSSLNWSEQW